MKFKPLIFIVIIPLMSVSQTVFSQSGIEQKVSKGQETIKKKANEKSKQLLGGFFNTSNKNPTRFLGIEANAFSNGWGAGVWYQKRANAKKYHCLSLQLTEIKEDKEERLKSSLYPIQGQGKQLPYIYGKQNSLYTAFITYGQKRTLIQGLISPAIDISMKLDGGIGIGILKPYYLKLNTASTLDQVQIEHVKYNTSNHDYFLDKRRIYSRSNFSRGWKESKISVGFQFVPVIQINLAPKSNWMKTLQVGSIIQLHTSKQPILVGQRASLFNHQWLIGILVGKGKCISSEVNETPG